MINIFSRKKQHLEKKYIMKEWIMNGWNLVWAVKGSCWNELERKISSTKESGSVIECGEKKTMKNATINCEMR